MNDSKTNKSIRARLAIAAGTMTLAMPTAAMVLSPNAAAYDPVACTATSSPASGSSWLTYEAFGCLQVSYSATPATAVPGEAVEFTLKLKGPGEFWDSIWLPIHWSDASEGLSIDGTPEVSTTGFADQQTTPSATIQSVDDLGWGLRIDGLSGASTSGGTDPDDFQTATISFRASVGESAVAGSSYTTWVSEPLHVRDGEDALQAALNSKLAGCQTTFTENAVGGFEGNWVPDGSDQGPLCATVALAEDETEPTTETKEVDSSESATPSEKSSNDGVGLPSTGVN